MHLFNWYIYSSSLPIYSHANAKSLKTDIDALTDQYQGGNTNTPEALRLLYTEVDSNIQ